MKTWLIFVAFFLAAGPLGAALRKVAPAPELTLPVDHAARIVDVGFSPTGARAVSAGSDGLVKVWDARTRKEIFVYKFTKVQPEQRVGLTPVFVRRAQFIDENRLVVVTSQGAEIVPVAKMGEEWRDLGFVYTGAALLTSDRTRLISGNCDAVAARVRVIDLASVKTVLTVEHALDPRPKDARTFAITDISHHAETATIVARMNQGLGTLVIDAGTGAVRRTFAAEDGVVAVLPSGELLALRTDAEKRRVAETLDAKDGRMLARRVLDGFSEAAAVLPLAGDAADTPVFVREGRMFFVWRAGAWSGPFRGEGEELTAAAPVPGAARFWLAGDAVKPVANRAMFTLDTFDAARSVLTQRWGAAVFQTRRIVASPERFELLALADGVVRHVALGAEGVFARDYPLTWPESVAFLPGRSAFVKAGEDGAGLEIVETGAAGLAPKPVSLTADNTRVVPQHVVVSARGKYLAGIDSARACIVDLNTGAPVRMFVLGGYVGSGEKHGARGLFSPDESLFVSWGLVSAGGGRFNFILRAFDVAAGVERWTREVMPRDLAFTDDGRLLRVLDASYQELVLEAATGRTVEEKPFVVAGRASAKGDLRVGVQGGDLVVLEAATGRETRRVSLRSSAAREAEFIGGDRFAITAGTNDGSLYLWDTRAESLAARLVLFRSTRDWAVVAADGAFLASEDAQGALYYLKQGEVLPLEGFFEAFYRPGLLAQVLEGLDRKPAPVDLGRLKAPPVVKLALAGAALRNLAVVDDLPEIAMESEDARLEVVAESDEAAITEIRLYHNEKLVARQTRGLEVADDAEASRRGEIFPVRLNPGENYFRAVALNDQRTESKPVELLLTYRGAGAGAAASEAAKPAGFQLHLLVVGIDRYKNPRYNLNYAGADAAAVRAAFERGARGIFGGVKIHALANEEADRAGILSAFERVKAEAGPRDVFVFYFAGHGAMSQGDPAEFFLVPHDVTQIYGADEALAKKALSSGELLALSQEIRAQKQLFILDACQSEGALQVVAQRGAAEEKAIAQLARSSGTHWLTASGSQQFAEEFAELGHGAFTYALLAGLAGKAGDGDGRVTVNELKAWLEAQVPEVTRKHKGAPQYPASYGYGQDFPVSVDVP